jgi:hypothetical protein
VVEGLSSKPGLLSSNSSTAKKIPVPIELLMLVLSVLSLGIRGRDVMPVFMGALLTIGKL